MILTKRQAFLEFNKLYENLKEGEKSEFSRITNKLLQVNYLTKRKQGDLTDYMFILGYKNIFEAFLAMLDFELEIKRESEVVYIKNESNFNHLTLRKTDSILLLVLRVLYQKKKENITINDDVEINLFEVHNELTRIGYLDNKRITKNELKPALSMFRSYNIIDYIDTGLHDDCRIKIYPTIQYVVNIENMKELLTKIDEYITEGKQQTKQSRVDSEEQVDEEVNQDQVN